MIVFGMNEIETMPDRFRRYNVNLLAAVAANPLVVAFAMAGDMADFKSPLDNSPMTFELQPGEVETPTVTKFKKTGDNDYRDNSEAIADGKKLYAAASSATAPTEPVKWARRWSARMSSTNRC